MPRDYDEDRPKKSWREIDKNKDRSKHRREEREIVPPHKKARAESASRTYKFKLDAFFDGEGKAPAQVREKLSALEQTSEDGQERADALKAIKDAGTSSAADKAVAAYLEKWELPFDFEILIQVLMCSDEEYLRMAVDSLDAMLKDKRIPKRTQLLEQRIRKVKTLSDDRKLSEKADELMRTLRMFS